MRRFSLWFLALLVVAGVFTVAPAANATVIDRDTGYDERDIEPRPGRDPDIQSTTRKLTVNDGRRVLAVIVRFYEHHQGSRWRSASTPVGAPRSTTS